MSRLTTWLEELYHRQNVQETQCSGILVMPKVDPFMEHAPCSPSCDICPMTKKHFDNWIETLFNKE